MDDIFVRVDDPTRGARRVGSGWSSVTLRDGRVIGGSDNFVMGDPPSCFVPLVEAATRAGDMAAKRSDMEQQATAPDPLLDSDIDIPIGRMSREFRKRAGRAYGLGDDTKADAARKLCAAIEDFERKFDGRWK